MLPLLRSGLYLFFSLQINAGIAAAKGHARRLQGSNAVRWNYTDVQYGDDDPDMQLLNIALPPDGEEPYGLIMFHHAKGSTYNDIGPKEVRAAFDSGYAFVSWESVGSAEGAPVDLEVAWDRAETCFQFLQTNAELYGWDANNTIIAGKSMGSVISWKLAHSQDPAIVGIYTVDGLPEPTWLQPEIWYPPDDVVSPAPPTYMVYGPGPDSDDGHNPTNAYPVRDKYIELEEEDKLTFVEGMWDNPELYDRGWINPYGTFHYFPDLIAQIEDGESPIMSPVTSPTNEDSPVSSPNDDDDDDAVAHPYEPFTQGANGLYIGHSFFVPIARKFDTFAKKIPQLFPQHGFTEEFSGGESGTPGNLWNDVAHRTAINASLSTGTIDVFGMTGYTPDGTEETEIHSEYLNFLETGIYPSAVPYIPEYTQWIDLALSYNPDTAIYVGIPWVSYNDLYTAENFTNYNEFTCGFFYNEFVLTLRDLYPNTQILYSCYGPVASMMRQMFEDDNLPDITDLVGSGRTALFTDDGRGHAGEMMKEMMSIIWLKILYDPASNLFQRYIQEVTTWNKGNVRDILSDVFASNIDYNVKEGQQQTVSFWE